MSSFMKIVLDPPSPGIRANTYVYGPEERVSGRAILTLAKDRTVESVLVDFTGQIRIRIDEDTFDYRYIFTQHKTLFQGPFKLAASTYEYPFSFQFPGSWNDNFVNTDHNPPFVVGVQSLPPTCQGQNPGDFCAIYYNITARISKSFGDLTYEFPVKFAPYRLEANPPLLIKSARHHSTFQSNYRLSADGIPRSLTTAEAWRERLHHNPQNQAIKFSVSARAPTAIVIGVQYNLELTLVSEGAVPEKHGPVFFLEHCQMNIRYHTLSRKAGSDQIRYHQDEHIPLRVGTIRTPLACNIPIEISGLFPSTPVWATIGPTFAISSLQRKCDLELKGTISYLGDDFRFQVMWAGVTMYSSRLGGSKT